MKNSISLLFIFILLILSIPVHAAPYHADPHPCIVNGIDLCEKPAPVTPIPVDVSCLTDYLLDTLYVHEESFAVSGYKEIIPYIPSLKMDKPPRA
jgi:hypothetical protein